MYQKPLATLTTILALLAMATPDALAQRGRNAPQIELSEKGREFEKKYSKEMERLKTAITATLPAIDDQAKESYANALKAEDKAIAQVAEADQAMGKIRGAQGLVGHARNHWIPRAEREIKNAEEQLEKAATDVERKAARDEIKKWQANKEEGQQALKERQAAADKAKATEPKIQRTLEAARATLEKAQADAVAAVSQLGLDSVLSSDSLDGSLAKYIVLSEATPKSLAAFAQQGSEQEKLIDELLASEDLLIEIAIADGAKDGNYARMAEIYSEIRKASEHSSKGVLHRLALAMSLEHATPVRLRNAKADTDAPEFADPVSRYLNFEKAYQEGKLDHFFEHQSVWNLRRVVDGEEPDDILDWGRQMLSNYRPDHITTGDHRWRYCAIVRSDVPYGSQNVKYDKDELQFFQNILMNGGICGRRAFIGRFILRAFGVPTTARPQRGHAALVRWTPDGWIPVLGAGWGGGHTRTPYGDDRNFLATTQARATGEHYKTVKRAQWIGDAMGERRVYGLINNRQSPQFWNSVSLNTQRALIANAGSGALGPVGEDIAEATETREEVEIAQATLTDEDRKIGVDSNGVITIPAGATTSPTQSSRTILFLNSNLGGVQLHYSTTNRHQPFEYTVEAPTAGKYHLTGRVVTPSWQLNMLLSVNGGDNTQIDLPFTVGMWDNIQPVEIALKEGTNTLTFTREGNVKGVSIRDFTLTPVPAGLSQR